MTQHMNRQWLCGPRPTARVDESNFIFSETPVPEIKEGEFLARAVCFALSPATRKHWVPDNPVFGGTLSRVIESKNPDFPVGDYVTGVSGWTEYMVSSQRRAGLGGSVKLANIIPMKKVEPLEGLPIQTRLHILGYSGMTAYFGLFEHGRPRVGDTLVVSGAAGTVGSLVCQLGKLSGCRVIGIAGSDEKCKWLTDDLGIDATINYKTDKVAGKFAELCPGGMDIYFDNIGGEMLDDALLNMAVRGRIVVCGETSQVEDGIQGKAGEASGVGQVGPKNYFNLVYFRGTMEGLYVFDHEDKIPEATNRLAKLYAEGKLKYKEDVTVGFEKLPQTLIGMMRGENFGITVVNMESD